jgi:hypothetical protein
VARSSTEAEYRALATAASDIASIKSLLDELGLTLREPLLLLYDNVGATQLSLNLVLHSRMKHIAIDLHFVREFVHRGKLRVAHVHTDDQLVDLLTKPLARSCFTLLREKFNVADGMFILRGRIRKSPQLPRISDLLLCIVPLIGLYFLNSSSLVYDCIFLH